MFGVILIIILLDIFDRDEFYSYRKAYLNVYKICLNKFIHIGLKIPSYTKHLITVEFVNGNVCLLMETLKNTFVKLIN